MRLTARCIELAKILPEFRDKLERLLEQVKEYRDEKTGKHYRWVAHDSAENKVGFGFWKEVEPVAPDLEDVIKTKRLTAGELRTLADKLVAEAVQMEEAARKPVYPPDPAWHAFGVDVQFEKGGKIYAFLVKRVASIDGKSPRFFTTGTLPEHQMFESWEALIDWLRSVYDHGAIYRYTSGSGRLTRSAINEGK